MTGPYFRMARTAILAALLLMPTGTAFAQTDPKTTQTGGQQQRIRTTTGVQPTQRINSRIQNRVPSRINNRIDPNYAPQPDAAAAIKAAEDQAKRSGLPVARAPNPE